MPAVQYPGGRGWAGSRVVCDNHAFTALVPFWAVWPFEILLVSAGCGSCGPGWTEKWDLADILRQVTLATTTCLASHSLFDGLPQAPGAGIRTGKPPARPFLPALLRSATVRNSWSLRDAGYAPA
jgi:UDPglucose--hexose-1-phosphate uridylyltransferase